MAELIIAMSVFIVMTAVATGAFVQSLRSQRALSSFMSVNSNAGLIIEQMAREIRTGHSFASVGENCSERINFKDRNGNPIEYRLANGYILKNDDYLTAPNVMIRKLCFRVTQENAVDPWRVNILMTVGLRNFSDQEAVNIQTTISPRLLPCDVGGPCL